jgi:uncharacterized protein (TIGR03067 family)
VRDFPLLLAVAVLAAVAGPVLARHVTHPVTPQNIDQQPFAFTVKVKDVDGSKEVEVVVEQKAGHSAPAASATGSVVVDACGKKPVGFPAVTRVQSGGVQTYTFRVPASDLGRTHFTFTETPQDARTPFPFPGDYWVLDLGDFAGGTKGGPKPQQAIQGTWLRMAVQGSVPQWGEDWRFEGGQVIFLQRRAVRSREELPRWGSATYKLDATHTPGTIDLETEDGKEVRGIYLLADDVLVVCLSKAGAARPSEFAADLDAGQESLQFQRQKPKARKPAK